MATGTYTNPNLNSFTGTITGSVSVTSIVPGTGATNLGKAEDGTPVNGDTGVMTLAVRKDSPPSADAANGKYAWQLVDANGAVYTTLATLISGEDQTFNRMGIEEALSYTLITTQTTTTIKSGAGRFYRFIISVPVATATVTFYDNTAGSGTQIVPPITIGAAPVYGPFSVNVGATFSTGLTIVTGTATMTIGIYYL